MNLNKELSERVFAIADEDELQDWLGEVDKAIGGLRWVPLGGIDNNVHTVEVASDPALALVERPTNSIDQLLDLRALELSETAPTPHAAAQKWWGVSPEGFGAMTDKERRDLADLAQVTMLESGTSDRPTITIQDCGTGQHPDDFASTLLSLLASNKKSKNHVMGVYNAGGAASYKFAKGTIVVSRLAPQLLNGRADEVGVSVVRYNPLDPEKFKSGVYEYLVAKDGSVIRLDLDAMPNMPYGAYIKLLEYEIPKYARGAHEPKSSLWHLFHAALPDPALPFRIIETRADRFPGVRGTTERRVVNGLLYLLQRMDTADYADTRSIDLGEQNGAIVLRYFVLNDGRDPDAYTTSDQSLTVTLNGQRQITKDRQWLKRNTGFNFLYKRLVVLVDGTGLTSAAKRQVFASTRESAVDSPLTKKILDRVIQELTDDEQLWDLDELAKQRTLDAATKSASEKIKRQLASQIGSFLKGDFDGGKGGKPVRKGKPPRKPKKPRTTDDSMLLEIPDSLKIISDPLKVRAGDTAALILEVNAKNGFLPKHKDGLSVVFGPELKDHLNVRSTGRLLGGQVRVTIEAASGAPVDSTSMKVAIVVASLGVLLMAEGKVEIVEPQDDKKDKKSSAGGEPDIDFRWVGRAGWAEFDPPWKEQNVGVCIIQRADHADKAAITKVIFVLNENFAPYEKVIGEKKFSEASLKTFQDGYSFPVLYGLFRQRLAEESKEQEADDEGRAIDVPDDYVEGEKARLARAVLMAKEPEIQLSEAEN